jgi:N-[(2S)-2-amino-2-carboxyethyl]-L-glutamate dehydrogenase
MDVRDERILYLTGSEVSAACGQLDVVAAVCAALALHAHRETVLPSEAYLAWRNHRGEGVRSLSMPGYVGGAVGVAGTKIINGNPENVGRGVPRASGLTLLFDVETGRCRCVMEGARISALRTAAVTALAAELLQGNRVEKLAVIGAGAVGRVHLDLLPGRLAGLHEVHLYDLDRSRAAAVEREYRDRLAERGISLEVTSTARAAIADAGLVVPVTTTTTGYIARDWLAAGALVVHVSLDDLLPEVVLAADQVLVDDWGLVRDDQRRLLGRMYRDGLLAGPDEAALGRKRVRCELGDVIVGRQPGRTSPGELILVNPFGLAIEDLALAAGVDEAARRLGLGTWLDR